MRLTPDEADQLADERAKWRWEQNVKGNFVRRPPGLSQTVYRRKDRLYGLAHGDDNGCSHHGPYASPDEAKDAADKLGAEHYRQRVASITGRG